MGSNSSIDGARSVNGHVNDGRYQKLNNPIPYKCFGEKTPRNALMRHHVPRCPFPDPETQTQCQNPRRDSNPRPASPNLVQYNQSNTIQPGPCPPIQSIQTPPIVSHTPLARTSYRRHNRLHSRMRGRAPRVRRHAPRRGDRLARGALPLLLLARNQRGRRRLRRREREMRATGQTSCIGEGLTENCTKK